MGIFNPHPGSWLGLPDIGITETIGKIFGAPTTNQGGSNILSTQPNASTPSYDYSNAYSTPISSSGGGSVLGANTGFTNPTPQPQQDQGNPNQGLGDAANAQAQAELNQALSDYDRVAEELGIQKGSAETQKDLAIGEINAQTTSAENRAGSLISEAGESRETEEEKALSVSQDTERKNRNILRALGILSSSAAGEMLAKPGEEFQKVSAQLTSAYEKRKTQVEDWLNEKIGEADRAIRQVTAQFNDIVARIDSDLRFNERDKINAVRSAQAALQERIGELNRDAQNYAQAAKQYNDNMAMQIAQLQLYQNPQANVSGILSSVIKPAETYKPLTAGILQGEDEEKKLLSGLGA